MTTAAGARYYVHTRIGALLRRSLEDGDQMLRADGTWTHTERIAKSMAGQDDDVDPVTEDHARAAYPGAF